MTLLETLGYQPDDRVVIFHADDIGMCHATLIAYSNLVEFGLLSSAAVMVPCPWFPEVAKFCRDNATHPNMDMGVHITLTCEWPTYRWGPISTRDPQSGMMDHEGFFYHTTPDARTNGDPAAVQVEMNSQVIRALKMGIDVTHIDSHMGTVFHPKFLGGYFSTALSHRLPMLAFNWSEEQLQKLDFDDNTIQMILQSLADLEARQVPLLDHMMSMPLETGYDNRIEIAKERIASLQPGVTHFIIHPAADTPELRAITPGDWQGRVGDYQCFMSEELRDFVQAQNIHVIGWRKLRDAMRHP